MSRFEHPIASLDLFNQSGQEKEEGNLLLPPSAGDDLGTGFTDRLDEHHTNEFLA